MTTSPPKPRSILLVEDDLATREAIAQFLQGQGYHVQTAQDGQEALDLLRDAAPPDLILLDLSLPVLDGWGFREQQRRDPALSGVPVVIVSAAGNIRQAAAILAAAGCLAKPIEEAQLLVEVQRCTARKPIEVLVVEDEPGVLKMLGIALRHHGFAVRLASSGPEALDLYRRNREHVDLVLLDVQMPGMDGPQTFASLHAIDPNVRAVFMSGNTGPYATVDLLTLGAVLVLPKPFASLGELAEALRQAGHSEKESVP